MSRASGRKNASTTAFGNITSGGSIAFRFREAGSVSSATSGTSRSKFSRARKSPAPRQQFRAFVTATSM